MKITNTVVRVFAFATPGTNNAKPFGPVLQVAWLMNTELMKVLRAPSGKRATTGFWSPTHEPA